MRGIAKFLLQWEREAQAAGQPAVFDHAFIAEHTDGVDAYLAELDATDWDHIERQSGLALAEIEQAARMYHRAERVIICWAMGITQHHHSVPTIQEIVNLQLLRGNLGRPGAGLCPVRGHSNVQGDRTMGINDRPPAACSTRWRSASSSRCPARTATTPWKPSTPCSTARPASSSAWAATSPRRPRTARAPTRR